jgi:hypothetical protein
MIIFYGTKKVGIQPFLIFTNEAGAFIEIPVDEKMQSFFLHHFDRLSPGGKWVEKNLKEDSEGE